MRRIITLTSDFGLADEFVGVMKGVILGRQPETLIVDLSHQVAAQDVRQAAYLLRGAWPFFPVGTVHVAVVDPGVGSERAIVLLERGGQYFLAPDNGLLSFLIAGGEEVRAWLVTRRELFLETVSNTFHGRDIFAPVAASLAGGLAPEEVGPSYKIDRLVVLNDMEPQLLPDKGRLSGKVVQVDHFGNLITNIDRGALERFRGQLGGQPVKVRCGPVEIVGLVTHYSEGAEGVPLALFGSRGQLELAVNRGRAAQLLEAGVGTEVVVMK